MITAPMASRAARQSLLQRLQLLHKTVNPRELRQAGNAKLPAPQSLSLKQLPGEVAHLRASERYSMRAMHLFSGNWLWQFPSQSLSCIPWF